MFKRKYGTHDYLVANDRGYPKPQLVTLKVAEGVAITTSNPATYEQHLGETIARWRDKGSSRPVKTGAKRGRSNKG